MVITDDLAIYSPYQGSNKNKRIAQLDDQLQSNGKGALNVNIPQSNRSIETTQMSHIPIYLKYNASLLYIVSSLVGKSAIGQERNKVRRVFILKTPQQHRCTGLLYYLLCTSLNISNFRFRPIFPWWICHIMSLINCQNPTVKVLLSKFYLSYFYRISSIFVILSRK